MPSPQDLRPIRASATLLVLVSTIVAGPIHAQRVSAPISLQVTGTAASATVTWQLVRGAISYSVKRWKQDDLKCCNNSVEGLTRPAWTDQGSAGEGFPQAGIYVFEVTAQLGATETPQTVGVMTWTSPAGAAAAPSPTIVAAGGPLSAPGAIAPTSIRILTGPAPHNVRVLPGGPRIHTLVWDSLSGISGYSVFRNNTATGGQWMPANQTPLLAATFADTNILQPGAQYRVTALYADGRQGSTDFVYANPPPLQVPTGFAAQEAAPGKVRLSWQPVAFATGYRVIGPDQPPDGALVNATELVLSGLANGAHSWKLTADYGGAYQTANLPSASITLHPAPVLPPTSINITGTPSTAKVRWYSPSGDISGLKSYSVERWRQDAPDCCRKGVDGLGSNEWLDGGFPQAGVYVYRVSAVYADGRRASAEATYNHPMPKNPTSISYSRASPASLKLTWSAVPYAAYYKLWGASNPDTGRYVGPCYNQAPAALQAAAAKFGQVIPPTCDVMVPAVKDSGNWMVGAFYQPGDISSPSTEFTKLVLGLPDPNTAPTTPAAKYRVSVSSFQVNHETVDDPLSLDGRGDEVYLSVVVLEPAALKPSATWTARSQLIESQVFGDRNNSPTRIKAGSRSGDGGLQTGDVVALSDPLVVWDGLISTPVLVIPTIWEWDGSALLGIQSAWYARMRPGGGDMLNRWKSTYTSPASFEYPQVASRTLQYLVDAPCTGCFIGTADAQATGSFQNPMVGYNRPIAVNMYGGAPFGPAFAPGVISLSPTNLAALLAGNSSAELPVNYKDQSEGMGDYTITLRFEKVP